jgi:hypothetical protein
MNVNSSHCISRYFAMVGFTEHYRAADGGQPAVIRVRQKNVNYFQLCVIVLYLMANK